MKLNKRTVTLPNALTRIHSLGLTFTVCLFALVNSLQASISGQGSDSTLFVVEALAEAFQAETGIEVKLQGGGSSAGSKALMADKVDFAFLSRGLKSKETDANLKGFQYSVDGVAVVVSQKNPTDKLSTEELRGFYSGDQSKWGNGKPVVLFTRNLDSGTREVFQKKVLGKTKMTPKAKIKHDKVIISTVAKIPTALAYLSLAEVDESKLKIVEVDGVKPSNATLLNGTYSLSRTPTLASKGEPSGEVKAFIDFVLSPKGQAIVKEKGLVPLQ